ncbi:MAG: hypothetical protein KC547_21170 [Anaerolineae bacterium]|nr:hypothetical protein [Anaerolineae bacterium]MCA9907790.1 hypothetical protein [Anaerolineae bacterium]
MPTQIDYAEEGIFYTQWSDPLTMDDVEYQKVNVLGYADQHGVGDFVVIIDMSKCSRIPMEVQNLKRYAMSDPRILGYVVVRIHLLAKMMVQMLDRLTPQQYVTAETPEEALAMARNILRQHEAAEH